ncbi:MAG: BTAD domain-containing putative transcriptional regulator [Ignavibacteria bacterium]
MNTNIDKKLLLITAPAGYGKTTLINEYIYKGNRTFGWLHINRDVSTVFQLLVYIVFSFKRLKSDFGENVLRTISQLSEDTASDINIDSVIDELTGLFINEFTTAFTEQTALVLDDLHEITHHNWHKRFFEQLILEAPDNLQIIITTRHLLEINLSGLRAKRDILEITQKELSFGHEEIKLLAKELYSRNYADKDIDYFEEYIGGWVTGIHLVIQALGNNTKVEDITSRFIPENLFEYFADEIFLNQDENIRTFLLSTSYLETFDCDICNELLGINNSAEILEYLSGKNIFIESIRDITEQDNIVIKYNYNQLFKTFLMNKSREIFGEKLFSVFQKIASYFSKSGSYEEAIKYFLLAGDFEASLGLLIEHFQSIFESSRFELLWDFVNSFEKNTVESNKFLLYYMCLLSKYYKGNLNDALVYIDKAITKAKDDDSDRDFLISCLITKSEILINQGAGKIGSAMEILKELENNDASDTAKARIYYFLGNCCFNISKYKESLEYLEKALKICKDMELTGLEPDIYNLLGNINILKGEFVLSNHYYELTSNKTRGLFKKLVAQANLTVLHSRTGKFEKSKEYLNNTRELVKLFNTPIFELVVKMTEYTLLFETGDYDSAFKAAQEINESALKLNSGNYIYLSYRFLGECCYYMDNPKIAIEYYLLSKKYVDKSNEGDEMQIRLLLTISELSIKCISKLESDLLSIYSYLDSVESNYVKACAGYYLAKYYLKSGNTDTAISYFEKTLSLAKDKEYYSFLQREYLASSELFDLAVKNNIHKKFIHDIYANITGILNIGWISENFRSKLEAHLRRQFDIKMTVFGGLEFSLKDKPIEESKWKRKKRKLILCYLLLDRNQQLSKDKIIDIFYPETSLDNADNLFHQSISNIRTALKPDGDGTENVKSKKEGIALQYIIYEGKTLKLNPDFSYYSDIEEFDSLLEKAFSKENNSEKLRLLKEAVLLYKGEALEGYYEQWCENLRSEYRNKFIKVLEQLLRLLLEAGQYDDITIYGDKLLMTDNLNETAYSIQIESLVRAGNIITAKEKYQQMLGVYKTELGEKPSGRIISMIETMLTTRKK